MSRPAVTPRTRFTPKELRQHYREDGQAKYVYRTLRAARAAAKELTSRNGHRTNAYHCPVCKEYHVGRDNTARKVTTLADTMDT